MFWVPISKAYSTMNANLKIFFSEFSLTNIRDLQDSRRRGKLSL